MKRVAVAIFIMLLIVGGASATLTWSETGGCWTASNGTKMIIKWNVTGSNSWTVPSGVSSVNLLVVGGGGGGSYGSKFGGPGGGGGGGVIARNNFVVIPGETLQLSVGEGGRNISAGYGEKGKNSTFGNATSNLIAIGGGGGGNLTFAYRDGGSGGGGTHDQTKPSNGTAGQGFWGGGAYYASGYAGGGGGGNASYGYNGTVNAAGAGGNGGAFDTTTETEYYGGGGGGGTYSGASAIAGAGGLGGGGAGGNISAGVSGTNGYGGGGGAGSYVNPTLYTCGYGGSGVVILSYEIPPLESHFTQSPNPSVKLLDVQFTDTSSGNPTSWGWIFGDGNYTSNTTQNPKHLFTSTGTYSVCLNATNAAGSNTTCSNQVVTNASGWNQQDIYMAGIYSLNITVTAASGGAPLPDVNITSSDGQSTITSGSGTASFSLPPGIYVMYFSKSGYISKSVSVAVDGDTTLATTMSVSSPASVPNTNTLYSPYLVQLKIVDAYGVPQKGAFVDVRYINSSLPSSNLDWLTKNFGVNTAVAEDMLNSSTAEADYTGSDGGFVFAALSVIRYGITITNATTGLNHYTELSPKDTHYTIYCPLASQAKTNNTIASRYNSTLPWYSLNSTHISLAMTYQDTSSCTSAVRFRVWFRNNGTEVHNQTWSNPGTALILDNHTVSKVPIGTEYLWQYNATQVC